MLHNLWTICSIVLIFFIIIHNPKAPGTGAQGQIFGNTRSAEQTINTITWILVTVFFVLTMIIASTSSNN